MEKQFVDLVAHVFTLQWAIWALPLSFLLCFLSNRVVPGFFLAMIAVVIHHVGPLALPILLSGGDMGVLPAQISAMLDKIEPLSILAEYVSYAFLIIVFSLTRQDMFRPGVGEHHG
jgi:ABC-type phosphate/phosphonate transport system permease subunit